MAIEVSPEEATFIYTYLEALRSSKANPEEAKSLWFVAYNQLLGAGVYARVLNHNIYSESDEDLTFWATFCLYRANEEA